MNFVYRNNVGYASTCNSLGQSFGMLIGSTVPILFTSEDFCNKYLRNTSDVGGVLTMKSKQVLVNDVLYYIVYVCKNKICTDDTHSQ